MTWKETNVVWLVSTRECEWYLKWECVMLYVWTLCLNLNLEIVDLKWFCIIWSRNIGSDWLPALACTQRNLLMFGFLYSGSYGSLHSAQSRPMQHYIWTRVSDCSDIEISIVFCVYLAAAAPYTFSCDSAVLLFLIQQIYSDAHST
jgi:hypothetical protein